MADPCYDLVDILIIQFFDLSRAASLDGDALGYLLCLLGCGLRIASPYIGALIKRSPLEENKRRVAALIISRGIISL